MFIDYPMELSLCQVCTLVALVDRRRPIAGAGGSTSGSDGGGALGVSGAGRGAPRCVSSCGCRCDFSGRCLVMRCSR